MRTDVGIDHGKRRGCRDIVGYHERLKQGSVAPKPALAPEDFVIESHLLLHEARMRPLWVLPLPQEIGWPGDPHPCRRTTQDGVCNQRRRLALVLIARLPMFAAPLAVRTGRWLLADRRSGPSQRPARDGGSRADDRGSRRRGRATAAGRNATGERPGRSNPTPGPGPAAARI